MTAVERYINTFVPEHYDLFLDINRKDKTFTGELVLSGQALSETISLHQKDLTITSVSYSGQALSFEHEHAKEAVHIQLPETGQVSLTLTYSGQITDNMNGIYPSYYTVDGVQKEVISTQFESHFARQAFPSIDEPEAKATFDLSIRFDQEEGEIVLSNMPEIDVDRRKETGIWRFDTTPRMSSYLLAFAIGDLHGQTATTKNGTEVGVFATRAHSLDKTDFALDIATRVIEFYEDYFGVKYPIPLSYHVGLPDFSAGAMENWGLITYREIYLLADKNATVKDRQTLALVIAHEVAHQWFGNLVTMAWWDDLWLNESFANMMEYLALDAIEPSWKILEDFQATGVPAALTRDATDGVQSVHTDVHHPDEIDTLFDPAIVYAKGSRLMVMLHRWLGDEAFRNGLRQYFMTYQYQNTIGQNLWDCLAEQSGKDVASFMDSWLEQPGYPLVTARVEDDTLILRQEQFFIGEYEDKGRLWQIPLNSNWTGLPDTLSEREIRIPNYGQLKASNQGALRLNTENTAHYLTNYEGELLDAVLADLPDLSPIDKRQILQERRFLAESGHLSYAELVPLLLPLAKEPSYLVMSSIRELLGGLSDFVDEGSPEYDQFNALRCQVYRHHYERLGWQAIAGEPDEDAILREWTLNSLVSADYAPALAQASAIFQDNQEKLEDLPAHMRVAVLIGQMKTAPSDELITTYLREYVGTVDSSYRYQILAALAWNRSDKGLQFLLSQLKDKTIVKPQDFGRWYAYLSAYEFSRQQAWDWACVNWDWLTETLGNDRTDFVKIPANNFKTNHELEQYRAFFEAKLEDPGLNRLINMGIKQIAARVDLVTKNKAAVIAAIAEAIQ